MSDVAVPAVGHAQPPTWRDAITPASRAGRRRWTLAYALLLCYAAVYFGATDLDPGGGAGWLVVVALFVVFGMLRRGTRRLTAIDHPGLDERDEIARDRAFRLAYPLLLVVLLAVVVVLLVALPDAERTVVHGEVREAVSGWFLFPDALLGLAVWITLWAIFLPTGVLAWLEPDALEPDPDEPGWGLSEIARDVLLGAALVIGLVLGFVRDSDLVALLPLAVVLMALGAAARRAAGRSVSPRRGGG
jgi:hypothetical protein